MIEDLSVSELWERLNTEFDDPVPHKRLILLTKRLETDLERALEDVAYYAHLVHELRKENAHIIKDRGKYVRMICDLTGEPGV